MSGNTSIEWTNKSWNPVTGCTKVSPGCAHCYAETVDHRFNHDGVGKLPWAFPASKGGRGVTLHPERLGDPLKWRKPSMVFVNSMSDLFHEDVPDGFIYMVWLVMARTPWHTYQVLTKRPQRMLDFVGRWSDLKGEPSEPQLVRGPEETRKHHPSGRGQLFAAYLDEMLRQAGGDIPAGAAFPTFDWMEGQRWWPTYPLPNVWLGVSVENQFWADRRIPLLLQTPATVRFISAEPLLGPVDLTQVNYSQLLRETMAGYAQWAGHDVDEAVEFAGNAARMDVLNGFWVDGWDTGKDSEKLDWVIAGGESGPRARPMHPDWIRSLRDQCQAAGVAFFCKQDSGPKPGRQGRIPDDVFVQEFPSLTTGGK